MRVLGILAKWPVAGSVKTRLARETTATFAADVAAAFLSDTLDRAATVQAERIIAFAPVEVRAWFEAAAEGRFDLAAQVTGDLGRRMQAFFDEQLERGADAVVAIGTDSPTLPIDHVERAFDLLATADLVLGPAADGGYYLIGMGRRLPPVFDGIAWSSSRVLAETVQRLDDPSWRLALLPPWYDVDTLDDWQALCGHMSAQRRAGIDPGVPRTEALAGRSATGR